MTFYFSILESTQAEKTSMWKMIKGFINLKLLMKPTFLLVGLSGFLSMLGFFAPLFFLPDMAHSNGIEILLANSLISIYGKL